MIGEAHPRLGAERFVKGTGRFVEDVRVPGMLHGVVPRSPHAHARLVSIDTKRAREFPGVRAVFTAADVPPNAIIPNRVPAPKGTEKYGFYQEVRATTNPLGLRGLGECGNPGLGGAIANAVCDALSPRESSITVLPLTPSRVYLAARSAVSDPG